MLETTEDYFIGNLLSINSKYIAVPEQSSLFLNHVISLYCGSLIERPKKFFVVNQFLQIIKCL